MLYNRLFSHLLIAFFHTWPVPHGRAHERHGVVHLGRMEETSLTLAAAGCGDTHCGSQALQGNIIMRWGRIRKRVQTITGSTSMFYPQCNTVREF